MSSLIPSGTFVTYELTTGDIGANAVVDPIFLKNVNIHVYAADVYYGSGIKVSTATQGSATPTCAIIRANAVVWFDNCYITSLFFKNYVNATPGYVVVTGVVA